MKERCCLLSSHLTHLFLWQALISHSATAAVAAPYRSPQLYQLVSSTHTAGAVRQIIQCPTPRRIVAYFKTHLHSVTSLWRAVRLVHEQNEHNDGMSRSANDRRVWQFAWCCDLRSVSWLEKAFSYFCVHSFTTHF